MVHGWAQIPTRVCVCFPRVAASTSLVNGHFRTCCCQWVLIEIVGTVQLFVRRDGGVDVRFAE